MALQAASLLQRNLNFNPQELRNNYDIGTEGVDFAVGFPVEWSKPHGDMPFVFDIIAEFNSNRDFRMKWKDRESIDKHVMGSTVFLSWVQKYQSYIWPAILVLLKNSTDVTLQDVLASIRETAENYCVRFDFTTNPLQYQESVLSLSFVSAEKAALVEAMQSDEKRVGCCRNKMRGSRPAVTICCHVDGVFTDFETFEVPPPAPFAMSSDGFDIQGDWAAGFPKYMQTALDQLDNDDVKNLETTHFLHRVNYTTHSVKLRDAARKAISMRKMFIVQSVPHRLISFSSQSLLVLGLGSTNDDFSQFCQHDGLPLSSYQTSNVDIPAFVQLLDDGFNVGWQPFSNSEEISIPLSELQAERSWVSFIPRNTSAKITLNLGYTTALQVTCGSARVVDEITVFSTSLITARRRLFEDFDGTTNTGSTRQTYELSCGDVLIIPPSYQCTINALEDAVLVGARFLSLPTMHLASSLRMYLAHKRPAEFQTTLSPLVYWRTLSRMLLRMERYDGKLKEARNETFLASLALMVLRPDSFACCPDEDKVAKQIQTATHLDARSSREMAEVKGKAAERYPIRKSSTNAKRQRLNVDSDEPVVIPPPPTFKKMADFAAEFQAIKSDLKEVHVGLSDVVHEFKAIRQLMTANMDETKALFQELADKIDAATLRVVDDEAMEMDDDGTGCATSDGILDDGSQDAQSSQPKVKKSKSVEMEPASPLALSLPTEVHFSIGASIKVSAFRHEFNTEDKLHKYIQHIDHGIAVKVSSPRGFSDRLSFSIDAIMSLGISPLGVIDINTRTGDRVNEPSTFQRFFQHRNSSHCVLRHASPVWTMPLFVKLLDDGYNNGWSRAVSSFDSHGPIRSLQSHHSWVQFLSAGHHRTLNQTTSGFNSAFQIRSGRMMVLIVHDCIYGDVALNIGISLSPGDVLVIPPNVLHEVLVFQDTVVTGTHFISCTNLHLTRFALYYQVSDRSRSKRDIEFFLIWKTLVRLILYLDDVGFKGIRLNPYEALLTILQRPGHFGPEEFDSHLSSIKVQNQVESGSQTSHKFESHFSPRGVQ
ncbi:hypothetical protein CPB83DRAFT_840874 [Crepidotus variabilis]|uniref:Uncharacterized protein n=1 Tax=Crepidotus variabilis TaxID=179855 RepID=A0A9P6JI19_9AGAR|nr:hypothetical protein CPB83DRAFT_840874 [Crepidotus variabilis]